MTTSVIFYVFSAVKMAKFPTCKKYLRYLSSLREVFKKIKFKKLAFYQEGGGGSAPKPTC